MSISFDELESFNQYAQEKLRVGGVESIAELARQWEVARERDEVNAALREAMEDLKAGRHRPAEEVSRDMRRKYNLPG